MKKLQLLGSVIVIVILVAGVGLAWRQAMAPQLSGTPTPISDQAAQIYSGKLVCLPHKDSTGLQTAECAFGIKTNEGQYYGVKTISGGQFVVGDRITVRGTLTSPTTDEKYDVTGNIDSAEVTVDKK